MSEIAGADEAVIGVGDGVFKHTVQLANIARPRVITEQLHRLASDAGHSKVMSGADMRNDVFTQAWNVL